MLRELIGCICKFSLPGDTIIGRLVRTTEDVFVVRGVTHEGTWDGEVIGRWDVVEGVDSSTEYLKFISRSLPAEPDSTIASTSIDDALNEFAKANRLVSITFKEDIVDGRISVSGKWVNIVEQEMQPTGCVVHRLISDIECILVGSTLLGYVAERDRVR